MRLFFALWSPRAAAAALHAWALEARRTTGGRVARAESIHLTLAFLGEIEERRVAELRNISASGEPHSLPIELACHWARTRIVWVGPNETPEPLQALAGKLAVQLEERKFPVETRPFAAHVTLIRKASGPGELPALPKVDWPVREYQLLRSQLSAGGPRYDVLERYPLG